MYGAWQDHVMAKAEKVMKIKDDRSKIRRALKTWAGTTGAFATGQSWLYGVFLLGGSAIAGSRPDYESILGGVATLTVAAPILGPLNDKVYQWIRVRSGLPAVPESRR